MSDRSRDEFERDRLYGRYVRMMKLVLPALAGVIILVLVVVPMFAASESGFTLDFAELTDYDDKIRMVAPQFAGVDKKGRVFNVKAEFAWRDAADDDLVNLDVISADVTLKSGPWLALDSLSGTYRTDDEILTLLGLVNVYSDVGYEVHGRNIRLDIPVGKASSTEAVYGQGPFGVFEAGGMELDIEGTYMHLVDGVKMVIYPRAAE